MRIRDQILGDAALEAPSGVEIPPADPVLVLAVRTAQGAVEAAGAALDAAQGALATIMAYAERIPAPDPALSRSRVQAGDVCPMCGTGSLIDVTGMGCEDKVWLCSCGWSGVLDG